MGKDQAPLQEHFRKVAQTQLVAHPPEHHETHDVRRVLPVIETCAGALVELHGDTCSRESVGTPVRFVLVVL